jgi:DNA-directed RNA polymerase subunit K/omega
LQAGAPPLVHSRAHKATRIAREELMQGALEYQVPDIKGWNEEEEKHRR